MKFRVWDRKERMWLNSGKINKVIVDMEGKAYVWTKSRKWKLKGNGGCK